MLRGLRRILVRPLWHVRSFSGDRRGVSAVEFALILPLLIVTYFGSVELSQALTAYRKVNHLGSVVGDLVAQSTGLTSIEMSNIFDAGKAVMSPFDSADAKVVVGYISIDDKGVPKVIWSAARNRGAYPINQPPPFTLPSGLGQPNTTIVVAQVEYRYDSMFSAMAYDILGTDSILLKSTAYFRPRGSMPITYAG